MNPPPPPPPRGPSIGQNTGSVTAGSGKLTNIVGTVKTTTTVTAPLTLPSGNNVLIDNEPNAVIVGGAGNNQITEFGTKVSITLGNGNDIINDMAGGATIVVGTGNQQINLGGTGNSITVGSTNGGTHDVTVINTGTGLATVVAGDGTMTINAGGANNTITVGSGNDTINLGGPMRPPPPPGGDQMGGLQAPMGFSGTTAGTIQVTADKLTLGNGTNAVFIGGSGNTIYDGSGTDKIVGADTGNNTFVLNANGGTQTIAGFSLTNGDTIDLSSLLAGYTVTAANLGTYITLSTATDTHNAAWTDTVLTIRGSSTDTLTLLNTGTLTLSGLTNSLILPH